MKYIDHRWMLENNIHLLMVQTSIFDTIKEEFRDHYTNNKDLEAL
jgi:hypothetical protein